MISYELAKELKDAGFPQYGAGHNIWPIGYDKMLHDSAIEVYKPTLSELIAACGEDFGNLSRYGTVWDAEPSDENIMTIGAWSGATPEEAVASLWLALNKT